MTAEQVHQMDLVNRNTQLRANAREARKEVDAAVTALLSVTSFSSVNHIVTQAEIVREHLYKIRELLLRQP